MFSLQLTGIIQDMVDGQPHLEETLQVRVAGMYPGFFIWDKICANEGHRGSRAHQSCPHLSGMVLILFCIFANKIYKHLFFIKTIFIRNVVPKVFEKHFFENTYTNTNFTCSRLKLSI